MAGTPTVYGDISPRTAAYAIRDMLKRGMPHMAIERFGQMYPLPTNSTKTAKFRRYFLTGTTGAAGDGTGDYYIPLATTPLVEGVTPSGNTLANHDVTVTIEQYGDFITITDVIEDTHEDPVLQQATEILGEQAAMTVDTLRFNVLKAGSNAFYAGDTAGTPGATVSSRGSVAGSIDLALQRKITTSLTRQNARPITQALRSSPDYSMQAVEAAFIGLVHPDLETDIREMDGFIPTKQYGSVTPWENEIGTVERVRYLSSTIFEPWLGEGTTVSSVPGFISSDGTDNDVYPIIYLARDAFGMVPLKGKSSLTPMVVNPKPSSSDPLAQRGTVGWKTYTATTILNDAWMVRAEVLAGQ